MFLKCGKSSVLSSTEVFHVGGMEEEFSRGGNKAALASLGRDLVGQMSDLGNPSQLMPASGMYGSGGMAGSGMPLQRLQPVAPLMMGHKRMGSDTDEQASEGGRNQARPGEHGHHHGAPA